MFGNISHEQANGMMNQMIDYEVEIDFNRQSDIIDIINKCKKHIKCLSCMDTKRALFTSEAYFFGGNYEEFTCPVCTGTRTRLDSHHQIFHAKVNGRQVPYNGGERGVYSRVNHIYEIYKSDYEKNDMLLEEKERRLAELEAENNRIANQINNTVSLQNESMKLEHDEKDIPHWDFMDDRELSQEISSKEVDINISELVGDVLKLMAISAGNIAALPSFLNGIKITLKYYWENENSKNNCFHKITDDLDETVYVKFEYKKMIEERKVESGIFRTNASSKKESLWLYYFIAKPTKGNKAAEKICKDLMNNTIQGVINKLNRQI
jgi:hypothetical protein